MANPAKSSADYILPLYMNGLAGRVLRLPAPKRKKREILFIYGHHSSLERVSGVADLLNRYGSVTIPDLPGFGGMESFYKIGEKPSIDNMADYLYSFIKLRYRNKRVTLAGTSLGFAIITRMLQKHPDTVKKIDMVCSMAGYTSKEDLVFKRRNWLFFRFITSIFSGRLSAALAKFLFIRGPLIRLLYFVGERISFNAKLATIGEKNRKERINFEIYLWKCNDLRTYMDIAVTMLTLDLSGKHVDLPVHHIAIENDHYFDNNRVEQHMRTIFSDFHAYLAKVPAHSVSIIANAKDAEPYVPAALRRQLAKNPRS